jgi:hypothetical protein
MKTSHLILLLVISILTVILLVVYRPNVSHFKYSKKFGEWEVAYVGDEYLAFLNADGDPANKLLHIVNATGGWQTRVMMFDNLDSISYAFDDGDFMQINIDSLTSKENIIVDFEDPISFIKTMIKSNKLIVRAFHPNNRSELYVFNVGHFYVPPELRRAIDEADK